MVKCLKKIIQFFAFSLPVLLCGCIDRTNGGDNHVDFGIESFTLVGTEQIYEREGDGICIYVPYETDVTNMRTEIVLSEKATVSPASGTNVNFTSPQVYTVKTKSGNRKSLTVTVKKSPWRQVIENGAAPFLKVDGHNMVAFNDKLWLLGGWLGRFEHEKATFVRGGDHWSSQVWCTSDGLNWESKGDAPWAGRHGFGCVVHDDRLWVIGGDQHTDVWNTADGVHWNKIMDKVPWGERYFPYIVSFKGKIWVMGGIRIVFPGSQMCDKYNDIWSSTDGVHWVREVEFARWAPRGLISGTAVLNDELYIYGGCILYSYAYNDVWKTGDGVNWTNVVAHAPWPPRQWSTAASFNNRLWIMAGDYDIRNDLLLNDVWYSSDGTTWEQQKGIFWKPRHAAPVVAFDNKLWLSGGLISRTLGGEVSNEVWVMDLEK